VGQVIDFAFLGLGLAAVYTLLAQGIVLIYRGSGVVNFAHGAFALLGAIVFTELTQSAGLNWALALVLTVAAGVVLGAFVQNAVMRRLMGAAPIARIIATLGIMLIIESAAGLHYGALFVLVPQFLPAKQLHFAGVSVLSDRLILFGIGLLVTLVLDLTQRRWLVAVATRAAAENDLAASTLGWSPNALASVNWAIGGALACLAGALIAPLSGLLVTNMVLLVVPALAAALLGGFDSFWVTLLGATGIGIAQSEIERWWSLQGAADAVPFLVIIVVLVVTGRSLPLRSYINERLPSVGSGLIRPVPTIAMIVLTVLLVAFVFNQTWLAVFTVSLSTAVIFLSVVVVTGYAGQVSLAQYALAGLGAFVAGRLIAADGWPFWAAGICGVIASVPIGVAFALPALRTRGVNLAVVSFGLGVAVSSLIFDNPAYTGGISGTQIGPASLFGWDVDSIIHPARYAMVVFVCFLAAAFVVVNVRRSAAGRRLIAIRENERAAASLGVSVVGAKLYAFAVAATIASVGGIVMSFQDPSIVFTNFDPFQSIFAVVYTVIGGIGYVLGPLVSTILVSGGWGTLLSPLLSGISDYLALIGGVGVVVTLMFNPDGIVPEVIKGLGEALGKLARLGQRSAFAPLTRGLARLVAPSRPAMTRLARASVEVRQRVSARALEVEALTVRFGGVVAADRVSLRVSPGEIVGLIGPNGAGKTTVIDAITGFVRPSGGAVRIGDEDLLKMSTNRRVRAGVARSWQSLELFEAVTVGENLQIASESGSHTWWSGLRSLAYPRRAELSQSATAAVAEFDLRDDLVRRPGDLPYGRRRLVGIARTVALNPSILLLDEPAAGLSESETSELGELLQRLATGWGMGILLVEHHVEMVLATCNRVVVLDFGKKIAEGKPTQVRSDPAVVVAYLGAPEPVGVSHGS
jgi:sulfate-transporting ATPase